MLEVNFLYECALYQVACLRETCRTLVCANEHQHSGPLPKQFPKQSAPSRTRLQLAQNRHTCMLSIFKNIFSIGKRNGLVEADLTRHRWETQGATRQNPKASSGPQKST